jgi:hypothetical protein
VRFRRPRPPAEVTDRLERDERLLAWGRTTDGDVVVATPKGLSVPGGRRFGWHEIDKAAWAESALTVIEGRVTDDDPDFVEDQPPQTWTLEETGTIPNVVRIRVNRSVAVTEHHDLHPSGGVRIVGRRVSGQDGLSWFARCDPGTDRHRPEVREQVAALLAEARARADLRGSE